MKMQRMLMGLVLCLAGAGLAVADAPEEHYFDSNGVKIRYITVGEGEPVLLIHGFTASAEMNWSTVIPPLSKKYKVIALDNRGHGKSGKPHGAEHYGDEMVLDSVRLLDHLGIEKAHVVGYSMGGFITAKMTTMHPERMLSATIGGAGWSEVDSEMTGMLDALADAIENDGNMAPLFIALTPEGEEMPEEQINMLSTAIMGMNDPKALASVARGMKNQSLTREALEKVDVPTQLIIGSKDPLKAAADAWMSVQKDDRYVVIDGADHMTAVADPQLLKGIEDFIAAQSAD